MSPSNRPVTTAAVGRKIVRAINRDLNTSVTACLSVKGQDPIHIRWEGDVIIATVPGHGHPDQSVCLNAVKSAYLSAVNGMEQHPTLKFVSVATQQQPDAPPPEGAQPAKARAR